MSPEEVEGLKRQYAGRRALVEFEGAGRAWYDLAPEFLKWSRRREHEQ